MRMHRAKNFVCGSCGKSFGTATALKQHVEGNHLDRSHSCDICGYQSKTFASLRNHILRYNLLDSLLPSTMHTFPLPPGYTFEKRISSAKSAVKATTVLVI